MLVGDFGKLTPAILLVRSLPGELHAGPLTTSTGDNMACRWDRYSLCGGKDCNSILRLPPRRCP